ncbi:MAG: hypothetical protein E6R13_04270 [Spirochaetes bacterium]|nr:MAG: hypothetical protein E6R13_04270 [Spirochaetota bacterium]
MKKLLFMFLLIVSCTSSAQDTFVRHYTSFIVEKANVKQPEKKITLTVVFNPNNENKIVFRYGDGRSRTFYQVTDVETGKTTGGYEYQLIRVIDSEDASEATLQLFDKDGVLRIIVSNGDSIEFNS